MIPADRTVGSAIHAERLLMRAIRFAFTLVLASLAAAALAGPDDFSPGGLIKGYGPIAPVPDATPLPADTRFKLAIDVVEGGKRGVVNGKFETAASFLNLHHANGIPVGNMEVALVVHGSAHRDILNDAALNLTQSSKWL